MHYRQNHFLQQPVFIWLSV